MTVVERLEALREELRRRNLKAYIIPSSDPHLSEYTPKRWTSRSWISGFTGSAGTVVVTLDKAGLWTDSRYFLQAATQLEGSTIELFKMGEVDTPSIVEFLSRELEEGAVVATDGACLSEEEMLGYRSGLERAGLLLNLEYDLIDPIWTNRPEIPREKIFLHPEEFAGRSAADKVAAVRTALRGEAANATIITMLDELAWVYNIRGYDVAFNPVAVGFGYIDNDRAVLFTLPEKVDAEVAAYLKANEVELRPYDELLSFVEALPEGTKLLVDNKRITARIVEYIPEGVRQLSGVSVVTLLKAEKNETELKHLREVMVRDGVAMTRFFRWLEGELEAGKTYTEYEIGIRLNEFRKEGKNFYGDSFATIAGYNGNGAVVHYRADEKDCATVKPEGVLLLDSGGQYLDGTTDITRTIALSTPSKELKRDYTLVLKGHIAIARAIYPEGTRGGQLDVLARHALWQQALNYGHGTGHGVGYFLNVHEGPQNIRTEINPTPLRIGMITSNEPGLYRAGVYGIRIETLIVTQLHRETEFGRFFSFETLTLCYFDNSLVDRSLLNEEELAWYNAYQERVYQSLKGELNEEEALWLREKTKAL